jgi:hypothetical protein
MSQATKKRGPGRPPSSAKANNIPRVGILTEPNDPNNIIELKCCNPSILTKLFKLLNAYKVREILFEFKNRYVYLTAKSHDERVIIYTTISGAHTHGYYSSKTVCMVVPYDLIATQIARIDPKHIDNIVFSRRAGESEIGKLHVVLHNPELEISSPSDINVNNTDRSDEIYEWNEKTYPVSFQLPSKTLKKYITDISGVSPVVMIEMAWNGPLKFKYNKTLNTIVSEDVFNNPKKIDLQFNGDDGTIVGTTVQLVQLRPLANTQVSDNVRLFVDSERDLIATISMDPAFEIKMRINVESFEDE